MSIRTVGELRKLLSEFDDDKLLSVTYQDNQGMFNNLDICNSYGYSEDYLELQLVTHSKDNDMKRVMSLSNRFGLTKFSVYTVYDETKEHYKVRVPSGLMYRNKALFKEEN